MDRAPQQQRLNPQPNQVNQHASQNHRQERVAAREAETGLQWFNDLVFGPGPVNDKLKAVADADDGQAGEDHGGVGVTPGEHQAPHQYGGRRHEYTERSNVGEPDGGGVQPAASKRLEPH